MSSREIKFRAWDKRNNLMWSSGDDGKSIKEWTFQSSFDPNDGCLKAIIFKSDDVGFSTDMIIEEQLPVMQYTSLKDRNGREIYEGDILKGQRTDNGMEFVGEVVYRFASFELDGVAEYRHIKYESLNKSYVVIGNVIDNPELLQDGEMDG